MSDNPDSSDSEAGTPEISMAATGHAERVRAIGSLIWKDPDRILDMVSRFRDSGAVIECRLRGGSMGAAVPRGSMLRISLAGAGPYRIGQVVAFADYSGICVHRVVYLGRGSSVRDYIITQGDACFYPDPPVKCERVLGAVTAFRQGDDWMSISVPPLPDRAHSPLGKALLSLIGGLLEMNVRVAQVAAKCLRIRKENASARSGVSF